MENIYKLSIGALLAAVVGAVVTAVSAEPGAQRQSASIAAAPAVQQEVVATVEGHDITMAEYDAYYRAFAQQRFYHRTPPANEVEALKTEVLERLILFRLLLIEADRQKIEVDKAIIDKRLAALRERYERSGAKESFESRVAGLRDEIQGTARVTQLEKTIREVPPPSETEVRGFYADNPELFTEPVREHVRAILIGVAPWDPAAAWNSAEATAAEVVEKLKGNQDFEALARQYSTHESAKSGGDLGYLHQGMLNEEAQTVVAGLAPGQHTGPIRTLEGYVVLQLVDRRPAQVQPFEEVRDRVVALYQREVSERNWRKFTSRLRQEAAVKVLENTPLETGNLPRNF